MSKKEDMFELISQQRCSGESQHQFCQSRGIKPYTFRYWLRRWRSQQESQQGFVTLLADDKIDSGLEIIFPNGVRIRGIGPDTQLVGALVQSWVV